MSAMREVGFSGNKTNNNDFEIIWENVKFKVTNSWFARLSKQLQGSKDVPKTKTILHGINGRIRSGELMALMGPSGAGKTTLMESIVGKREFGKSGDINIYGDDLEGVRVSFIAQHNYFLKYLTVRETILFATKIHCATKLMESTLEPLFDSSGNMINVKIGGKEYCTRVTDKMIADLKLNVCEHNRVPNCSGGQLKRLAMAQELVAKPRVMILDEPTSGLDSASCYQVVEILRQMTQKSPKIAILLTIHQPSFKILNLFHKLYVISSNADCIYEDTPKALIPTLNDCGVTKNHGFNPAEIILEVAYGEYGEEVIRLLGENQIRLHNNYIESKRDNLKQSRGFNQLLRHDRYPTSSHVWTLVHRNYLITIRDPIAFGLRFASVVGVSVFLTSVFGTDIGIRGGCPPKFDADFEPSQLKEIGDEIEAEIKAVYNNTGNMFFITLFFMFSALMPSCLTFPGEMIVFKMEKENSWYSSKTFYIAKFIAETPFQLLIVTSFLPLTFMLQNQIPVFWRFAFVYVFLLLVEYIAYTLGFITGTMFMYNVPASVYLGPTLCMIPFMLLSGAFAKVKEFSETFQYISLFSYLRFAIEGISVALYGFNRCGSEAQQRLMDGKSAFVVWMSAMLGLYKDDTETETPVNGTVGEGTPTETFVEELIDAIAGDFISDENEVRSAVQNIYAYENWHLYRGLFVLILYLIILRLIAYSLIKYRTRNV